MPQGLPVSASPALELYGCTYLASFFNVDYRDQIQTTVLFRVSYPQVLAVTLSAHTPHHCLFKEHTSQWLPVCT